MSEEAMADTAKIDVLKVIRDAGLVTCAGCGCEPEYEAVTVNQVTGAMVGYRCACGAVVHHGIFQGSSAMNRR
jgi:hypothetical protein